MNPGDAKRITLNAVTREWEGRICKLKAENKHLRSQVVALQEAATASVNERRALQMELRRSALLVQRLENMLADDV